jgi:hypothetical protein
MPIHYLLSFDEQLDFNALKFINGIKIWKMCPSAQFDEQNYRTAYSSIKNCYLSIVDMHVNYLAQRENDNSALIDSILDEFLERAHICEKWMAFISKILIQHAMKFISSHVLFNNYIYL